VLQSLVAIALVAFFIALNTLYFSFKSVAGQTPLQSAIFLMALQPPGMLAANPDPLGTALLGVDLLFDLVIAQSLFNAARLTFSPRTLDVQQRGLASVLRNHVVVCGIGRVGMRIITRLVASGYPVAVINDSMESEYVLRALHMHVPVIAGEARDHLTLRRSGLMHATAVIACIDNDLLDVQIALEAQSIRPGIRVIMRAFSEDFDRGLEQYFGADSAFSTSALGAPTFAAATVSRNVGQVLPIEEQLLGVMQSEVPLDAARKIASDQVERANGVRVIRRQRVMRMTAGGRAPHEELTLIGPLDALERTRVALGVPSRSNPAHFTPTPDCDTVIICGLGKVGYRVVRLLHRLPNRPRIVVIDTGDQQDLFRERIRGLDGVDLIEGDARDDEKLLEAGLKRAFAVAALTSSDQINLQIALEARRIQPGVHIVLRVFRSNLANKLSAIFGIHTTFSTSNLASATLAAAALLKETKRAFALDNEHTGKEEIYGMQEVSANAVPSLLGQTIASVHDRTGVVIIGIRRGGIQTVLPDIETPVQRDDVVTLVGHLPAVARLRGIPFEY
jgi:Trk K+ transport system NAD-binding subunit